MPLMQVVEVQNIVHHVRNELRVGGGLTLKL
jgi:hypothetical protein